MNVVLNEQGAITMKPEVCIGSTSRQRLQLLTSSQHRVTNFLFRHSGTP